MVVVTTPKLATKVRVLASQKFENVVLSSCSLANGTIIGVIPRGLITGYEGAVGIEISSSSTIHLEDTNPKDIINGTPADPTKSGFQENLLVLRVRAWCAWTIRSGAIAAITGAQW
ncbi:MAG: hypothetical protein WAK90_04055 [Pseudolabrys sp.]